MTPSPWTWFYRKHWSLRDKIWFQKFKENGIKLDIFLGKFNSTELSVVEDTALTPMMANETSLFLVWSIKLKMKYLLHLHQFDLDPAINVFCIRAIFLVYYTDWVYFFHSIWHLLMLQVWAAGWWREIFPCSSLMITDKTLVRPNNRIARSNVAELIFFHCQQR